MFVIVSWVSFLVKPEVVPGRMAMLVTLFLVLINIFNSVRSICFIIIIYFEQIPPEGRAGWIGTDQVTSVRAVS